MSQINDFNLGKYDKGGINAQSGDNRLTGEEAENARRDGWTVWDNFCPEDTSLAEYVESSDEQQNQSLLALKTFFNSRKSESYKLYEKRVNEILVQIISERYGITLPQEDYYGSLKFSDFHFDDRYKEALKEAKAQARKEFELSDNAFGDFIPKEPEVAHSNLLPDIIGRIEGSGLEKILPGYWDPGFGGYESAPVARPHFPGFEPREIGPYFPNRDDPWGVVRPTIPNLPIGGIGSILPPRLDPPSYEPPVVVPPVSWDDIGGDEPEMPAEPPIAEEPDPWDDIGDDEPEIPAEPPIAEEPDPWDEELPPAVPEPSKPSKPEAPSKPSAPAQPAPGGIQYHPPTSNPTRDSSTTNGNFYDGWIAKDAFGSETYEEWLSNNGYEYDASAAQKLRDECAKNAKNPKLQDLCGRAFRLAAQKLGLWEGMNGQDEAYQFASELAKNPNFKELPNNIVATMDLTTLPPGCVIIYDAGYKSDGKNAHGHVGVTTGNGTEYGGYCPKSGQKDGSIHISQQRKADHIRVFIPVVRK